MTYTTQEQEMMHEIHSIALKYGYRVVLDECGSFLYNDSHRMIFMSDLWNFKNNEVLEVIDVFDEIGYDEAESALESQGSVDEAIIEIRGLRI